MELEPNRSIDWFVLDGRPVIFHEAHQKLISLDAIASHLWQTLWPDCVARTYTSTVIRETAAIAVASRAACSLGEATSFAEMCIQQWKASGLIVPPSPVQSRMTGSAGTRIVRFARTPRHGDWSGTFRSFQLDRIVVSMNEDGSLAEVTGQIFGHLPAAIDGGDMRVSVRHAAGGYKIADWRGRSEFCRTPDDVAARLKTAILGAELARHSGAIALHAAALVHNGAMMIVAGGSGSGKSTLAAALCSVGYTLIGEDVILLDAEAGVIRGLPLAHTAKRGSWPALQRYFPELGDIPQRTRPDGKCVKYLWPRSWAESAPISSLRQVIFPRYRAGWGLEMHRVARTQALVDMLQEALSQDHRMTRSAFRALCSALAGAKVRRLEFGDLEAAIDHIRTEHSTLSGTAGAEEVLRP
ncbi:hypothetical protein [Nitratireductor sp. ZSWI3]|uniref:hypothetical protein n=1 Tax=Nitratireductor sp. ZSWI3 TaxID=2966359 RepID=UPI00214FB59A|nr:hypothetical protein [Nitratireductor sp. ZSWI3]MCR4267848.1 hypothetical protein [Nitratireductor sp. ZSWI3]